MRQKRQTVILALALLASPLLVGAASAQSPKAKTAVVKDFCAANSAKVLRCRAQVSGNGQLSRGMWLACMGLPRNSQQHC